MRIAQVAPLYERVPPQWYGGTERMVSYLTEELVRQGHEVTLFASGDSVTQAKLVPVCPKALRLANYLDQLAYHVLLLERVMQNAASFNVIHYHLDYLHFPLSRRCGTPQVTTLHARLDLEELAPLYREFADLPLVSVSDAQRAPLPDLNWVATVYHGLPEDLLCFHPQPGNYLAFLGRISPDKRADRAIEIATGVGMPLRIAAKVDRVDQEYFENVIKPLLDNPLVDYIEEINETQKDEFLGNAFAHLFPIDWPEPFGLTMIEAMACGTPTIAFRRGAAPEVMVEGETGFVVEDVPGAVKALEKLSRFDRARCRRVFEERFTAQRMAQEYLSVYNRLLESKTRWAAL